MTNYDQPGKDEQWEPSTKHRDKQNAKEQEQGIIKSLIKAVNLAVRGWNKVIPNKLSEWKLKEMDPDKSASEIMSGGGAYTLGWVDDALKAARKFGLPIIEAIPFAGGVLSLTPKIALGGAEIAVDHLKDALQGMAFSGLSADIGDLKDGQAKLNSKVDAQGKRLGQKMDNLKSELQGEIKQQGEKFDKEIKRLDAEIANCAGEIRREKEERRREMAQQKQELESKINEVTQNLNRVESQLTQALDDFKNEVNERFERQEQKILENKCRIHEEKLAREAKEREIRDKINLANTKIENLQQEKEELSDNFDQYKSTIDQKMAETQQALEDTQAEYERKTKILETKIQDNQEVIEEFNEELNNVRREQAFQRTQQEEILDNLQETNDLLSAQQRKLNLVAEQMDDIQEELHEKVNNLSQKVDARINETLEIAEDTAQKLDKLTEQVQNIQKETEQLQEQIKQNKAETEKAKQEAKLANERLDNLLKTQALADYSAEQSKLDKIQKSLELKAEETKLLATLNLLQETRKLITPELSEIDWKVGIKKGTEKDIPRPEGMSLDPNSSWAKKYTPEQLREWGWDTRLLGEHETAPLTDPEKRKEKQAQQNEQNTKAAGEESTQAQETLEKVEQLKSETLERLAAIQVEIKVNLDQAEEQKKTSTSASALPKPSQATAQQVLQASQKVKIKQKALQRQKEEEKKSKQQIAAQPTKQNAKQLEQEKKETQKAEQALQQVQAELSSLEKKQEFEEALEEKEDFVSAQQKELEESSAQETKQQWAQIQVLSAQVLQENQDQEKPEETKEEDLNKKLEEVVQQLKEMDQSAAASQKTMTMFLLLLIIFLAEYIVYKRNGLPGLVILNVILAIAYYHRETLKEYAELWGNYLLIIGYIMGNVLAYSAPEQEKYKWPSVIGFNLTVLALYAYTLYQKKQEQAKIEAFYQQQTKEITEEFNLSEEWKDIQQNSQPKLGIGGIIDEYSLFSNARELRTEQLNNLQTANLEKQIAQQKELEIKRQTETLQKAAELEAQLKSNLEQAAGNLGVPRMTWELIQKKYPQLTGQSVLLAEFEKANKLLDQPSTTTNSTARLERLPLPDEDEETLLSNLSLTIEQYIAISLKTPYLIEEEQEFIVNNYPTLERSAKFQLLSAGLNTLGIDTYEKKEKLVELVVTCQAEAEEFGLTIKEKEKMLEFLNDTLDLTEKQKKKLEKMGLRLYNASEWTVTEEQKNSLLDFGLNKLTLTKAQTQSLTTIYPDTFRTFPLTTEQKNILTSLTPLTREDKYSEESLTLLKDLKLKPTAQTFLVQEEIIPDPYTSFGTPKSSYLPLKEKFLAGEQKILRTQRELEQSQKKAEEIRESKLSILRSLMRFTSQQTNQLNKPAKEKILTILKTFHQQASGTIKNYLALVLDHFSSKSLNKLIEKYPTLDARLPNLAQELNQKKAYLYRFNYSLATWVAEGVLTSWQADILLTCGFKTLPKYNFFELLIYAVEKFAGQNWNDFLAANKDLTQEFEEYTNFLKNQAITINQTIWEKYASSQSSQGKTAQDLDLQIIAQQVSQILGGWTPPETSEEIKENWTDISFEFTSTLVQEWKNQGFTYETTKEWIDVGLTAQEANFAHWLRDEKGYTPEEVLNGKKTGWFGTKLPSFEKLREEFREWSEAESVKQEEKNESASKETPKPSRYDDLFANLNKEEAERQRKKLAREEAQKKLQEQELARRKSKLSEKDRKLKEEQEKREQERKLAEQEEAKRDEARQARNQNLREEQEAYFDNKIKNLNERQKAAQEALEAKQKENDLEEQKQQAQIKKMKKENQIEQQRLAKEAQLIESRKQQELAAVALEDKEQRQEIERRANEEKARIEREVAATRRRNEEEMKKKENQLKKEREAREEQIRQMQREAQVAANHAQEAQRQYQQEVTARQSKEREWENAQQAREQLASLERQGAGKREIAARKALNSIYNYYLTEKEWNASVQGESFRYSSGRFLLSINQIFEWYPSVRINPYNFQWSSGEGKVVGASGAGWHYQDEDNLKKAIAFLGSRWWTKAELEEHIKKNIGENF